MVEFLSARADTAFEGKLMRVNALQALARWESQRQAMETRQWLGWRTHEPEALQVVWRGERGELVEMQPHRRSCAKRWLLRAQYMRHCVGQFGNRRKLTGGYAKHYAASCEQGRIRLFSYCTGQSQPCITLSALVKEGGKLEIEQIKGKQNLPPVEKYHAEVLVWRPFFGLIPRGEPQGRRWATTWATEQRGQARKRDQAAQRRGPHFSCAALLCWVGSTRACSGKSCSSTPGAQKSVLRIGKTSPAPTCVAASNGWALAAAMRRRRGSASAKSI